MTKYIETIGIELNESTEISSSAPETDMIVEWAAPPQTLMIPGVGVIASMCKRCVKMQSPELCKPRSGEVESSSMRDEAPTVWAC